MKEEILNREYWVFDLDNTIYPAENNLFAEMNDKMRGYIMNLLNLDSDSAHKVQKDYFYKYGTSLAGLIANDNVDPLDFLEYVHDLDYSVVEYDEELRNILNKIPNKKYIHTNGTAKHANKVLEKLQLQNAFIDCFDIIDGKFIPKPEKSNYDGMIEKFGIDTNNTVFFEDMAKNLVVPKQMGMTTVWLCNEHNSHQYDEYKDFIDYKIDDLVKFLSF